MKTMTKSTRGFTLLELLIVVMIISILSAALYPVFGYFRKKALVMQAQKTMGNISMAMEQYRSDFGTFPPDDKPGSEMIWTYLCRVLKPQNSEMKYGPYLKVNDNQLSDPSSNGGGSGSPGGPKQYLSPLGGEYKYALLVDSDGQKRTYVLVDPGPDKELGGSVNPTTGFSVDDAKKAADNIYSSVQIQTYNK